MNPQRKANIRKLYCDNLNNWPGWLVTELLDEIDRLEALLHAPLSESAENIGRDEIRKRLLNPNS
jgi:hypothetical protein